MKFSEIAILCRGSHKSITSSQSVTICRLVDLYDNIYTLYWMKTSAWVISIWATSEWLLKGAALGDVTLLVSLRWSSIVFTTGWVEKRILMKKEKREGGYGEVEQGKEKSKQVSIWGIPSALRIHPTQQCTDSVHLLPLTYCTLHESINPCCFHHMYMYMH